MWQRMVVWCDGQILPCNEDDRGLLSLGDVRTTTIRDAWMCDALGRLRDTHMKGKAHDVPACDGCYLRDAQMRKLGEAREEG